MFISIVLVKILKQSITSDPLIIIAAVIITVVSVAVSLAVGKVFSLFAPVLVGKNKAKQKSEEI